MTLTIADFTNCEPRKLTKRDAGGWREECAHGVSPIINRRFISNDETIRDHEAQVLQMTVKDILECVNDGRSEEWLDYDEEDWIEGMYEWTYLCLTDRAVYELLGNS
jgi:hypothetical protein